MTKKEIIFKIMEKLLVGFEYEINTAPASGFIFYIRESYLSPTLNDEIFVSILPCDVTLFTKSATYRYVVKIWL
jgi:hypothetical protein